jgi:4-hydroxybenzoate polyprenyltransferase
MSDDPPAPIPEKTPEPSPRKPLSFGFMIVLGILLLVLACGACALFQNAVPFWVGVVAAVLTLFFKGYRGVFVGFAGTVGVVLLVAAIICGAMLSGTH